MLPLKEAMSMHHLVRFKETTSGMKLFMISAHYKLEVTSKGYVNIVPRALAFKLKTYTDIPSTLHDDIKAYKVSKRILVYGDLAYYYVRNDKALKLVHSKLIDLAPLLLEKGLPCDFSICLHLDGVTNLRYKATGLYKYEQKLYLNINSVYSSYTLEYLKSFDYDDTQLTIAEVYIHTFANEVICNTPASASYFLSLIKKVVFEGYVGTKPIAILGGIAVHDFILSLLGYLGTRIQNMGGILQDLDKGTSIVVCKDIDITLKTKTKLLSYIKEGVAVLIVHRSLELSSCDNIRSFICTENVLGPQFYQPIKASWEHLAKILMDQPDILIEDDMPKSDIPKSIRDFIRDELVDQEDWAMVINNTTYSTPTQLYSELWTKWCARNNYPVGLKKHFGDSMLKYGVCDTFKVAEGDRLTVDGKRVRYIKINPSKTILAKIRTLHPEDSAYAKDTELCQSCGLLPTTHELTRLIPNTDQFKVINVCAMCRRKYT